MASTEIIQTLGIVAEVVGHELSAAAARLMVESLSRWPDDLVLAALRRCARECRGRLTLADIEDRIDDGRPGPEAAWAMIPHDERSTVVWTQEMATAFGSAGPLLACGDAIGARMAFLETYRKELRRAREDAVPVRWTPSLGHDASGRDGPIREAVRLGRLSADHVTMFLPELVQDVVSLDQLTSAGVVKRIGNE